MEYSTVVWHSSLTEKQSKSLERFQSVALNIILNESYVSYDAACEMTGLEKLYDRRSSRCLDFGLKSSKHPQNSRFFPQNVLDENQVNIRNREPFHVNFARTSQYKNSAIPYIQRRLNEYSQTLEASGASGPGHRRAGERGRAAGGQGQARRLG